MLAVPLGWAALWWWPGRRDLFTEYCRRLAPHPAEQGLDPLGQERLHQSAKALMLQAQAEETRVDSGGGF